MGAVTLFTASRKGLLRSMMKSSVILGLFGLCLGSPINSDYPDYADNHQGFQPEYVDYNQGSQSVAQERSQAYHPPAVQVLDDSRYESRFEGDQDYYYDEYEEDNLNSIPGEPGTDFPILGEIPRTSFSCADNVPGFYADMEADCQVWHYCKPDGHFESFLCPNGTIYNQENRVCEWWFNVNCEDNNKFARINEDLYIVPEPDIQAYREVEQRMYRQQQQKQQQQQQYEQQQQQQQQPVYQQDAYKQ